MSKLTEQLRSLGVFNSYEFAGQTGQVWIEYYPAESGRAARYGRYVVHRRGYKTDPKAHWLDYGNKTFPSASREEKPERLKEAVAWASARYHIKEWARTPFGGWMDAEFVQRRIAELKAAGEPTTENGCPAPDNRKGLTEGR